MARSVQKYNTLEILIRFKLAISFSEYLNMNQSFIFKILKRYNLTIYLSGMLVMAAMDEIDLLGASCQTLLCFFSTKVSSPQLYF